MTPFYAADNCSKCTQQCVIYKGLNETEMNFLADVKKEVSFKAGEMIFKQGMTITHMLLIHEGYAKVYLEGQSNKDVILQVLKPHEMFGGPGVFNGQTHYTSVTALTNCRTCFIEVSAIKDVIRSNHRFVEAFHKESNIRTVSLYQKLLSLSNKQINGRMAEALLYLHNDVFQQNPFDLIINRQELGELSGMNKETVSRVLKDFENEKTIALKGKTIEILNMPQLQSISKNG